MCNEFTEPSVILALNLKKGFSSVLYEAICCLLSKQELGTRSFKTCF